MPRLATVLVGLSFLLLPRWMPAAEPEWKSLFDGQKLGKWESTKFGGEGEINIKDERMVLEFGSSLTGVTYGGDFPTTNYELRLEAMRVDGIDFFCGLTFPVADSHCSFIVGGWAGTVVGLSTINGLDAARNDTRREMVFKTGQWYRIRVRVTPGKIQCLIDDKLVVDQDLEGRRIATRPEVDLSKPLGVCAWETKAALRKIEWRKL